MMKTAAEQHRKAAERHEKAAEHHREAAKYYEEGVIEKGAHHSLVAHGHATHAANHAEEAAKAHVALADQKS